MFFKTFKVKHIYIYIYNVDTARRLPLLNFSELLYVVLYNLYSIFYTFFLNVAFDILKEKS